MGIIQRQSIKSTIYIYLGVAVGFLTTGILMPNYLTTSENGVIKLLVSYSLIFAQFGSLGFNNAMIRFFPYFRNKEKQHHGMLFLGMSIQLAGFFLFLLLFYLLSPYLIESNQDNSPQFASYLWYIAPLTFFTIYYNLFDYYARSIYYSTIGTFLKELIQRVLILLALALYIFNFYEFSGFVIAYIAAISSPALIFIIFLLSKNQFNLKPDFSLLNKKMVKNLASMSAFGVMTGFSTIAISQIDSIMINQYYSTSETGIYAITYLFGTLVILPSRGIQRIATSLIATAFKENKLNMVYEIYYKSSLNQMLTGSFIFLVIWLNIGNVFRILPQEYEAGKFVIFFIGLANLVNMATTTSGSVLGNSKYYRLNAWYVAILMILTVATNLIFIPKWGITGAAFASFLSTTIYSYLKFQTTFNKFGFQPYDKKYFLIIGLTLMVYFLVNLIPQVENLYLSILLISAMAAIIFGSGSYLMGVSQEFNNLLKDYLSKIRKDR